jgi:hypothetical protein
MNGGKRLMLNFSDKALQLIDGYAKNVKKLDN